MATMMTEALVLPKRTLERAASYAGASASLGLTQWWNGSFGCTD